MKNTPLKLAVLALPLALIVSANSLVSEVKTAYLLQAVQRSLAAAEPVMTAEEREAAGLVVEPVPPPPGAQGPGGGGGSGFRPGGPAGPALPDEFNAELSLLVAKKMTVLQIRDFLSGEFTPLPLSDVLAVLREREKAGSVKITVKAPEPKAPKKK